MSLHVWLQQCYIRLQQFPRTLVQTINIYVTTKTSYVKQNAMEQSRSHSMILPEKPFIIAFDIALSMYSLKPSFIKLSYISSLCCDHCGTNIVLQEHGHEMLDDWKLTRVSDQFRVIALGLPVPPYHGNPLDPPLRSRFQSRNIAHLPFHVCDIQL